MAWTKYETIVFVLFFYALPRRGEGIQDFISFNIG